MAGMETENVEHQSFQHFLTSNYSLHNDYKNGFDYIRVQKNSFQFKVYYNVLVGKLFIVVVSGSMVVVQKLWTDISPIPII